MAKKFCIPKELATKLKKGAQDGKINVNDLFAMSSQERSKLFENFVDSNTAHEINAQFENSLTKSTVAAQKKALQSWATETFTGSEVKKVQLKNVLTKINELDKLGVLTPANEDAFLSDLVAERLGATITPEEAKNISGMAQKLEALAQDQSEFGTPTIEYWKVRKQMDDYLDSLTPSSRLKVLTSTIFRGNMLTNPASALLNIESNTIEGFLQAAERRIASRKFLGGNGEYARKYAKFVRQVYNASGYDMSRFEAQGGGKKSLGEDFTHSQGKGAVRAVGRVYNDLIFKKTQGLPDVIFSAYHFADSANLQSGIVARSTGLTGEQANKKALEIFKDATRLEPATPEGQQVRAQAQADALMATYTNDTIYSNVGLGLRKVMNLASGDLRAGDVLAPFVKTPANVIGAGLDQSGITVPLKVIKGMQQTINDMRKGVPFNEARQSAFKGLFRSVVRAGLGLTFAYLITKAIKPDDFIGAYPTNPSEQQLLALRNAPTNSIRIGGKWISLDYLGPLGAPLLGMLYARKYGKTPQQKIVQYVNGVKQTLLNFPGWDTVANTYSSVKAGDLTTLENFDKATKAAAKGTVDFLSARIVPALVSTIAKITDNVGDRVTDKNDVFATVKKSLPGLRETLPEKKNIFGQNTPKEDWSTLLFTGSRVKTARDDAIVNEIVRLDKAGQVPSISDVSKSSARAKQLKEQIGEEKFNSAMDQYSNTLKTKFEIAIKQAYYKRADDEKKKSILDNIKTQQFDLMLRRNHYRKPKK